MEISRLGIEIPRLPKCIARFRAAAELGISRMGLYRKIRKYGLNTA